MKYTIKTQKTIKFSFTEKEMSKLYDKLNYGVHPVIDDFLGELANALFEMENY